LNIPAATTITAITNNTITLSNAATTTGSQILTFGATTINSVSSDLDPAFGGYYKTAGPASLRG